MQGIQRGMSTIRVFLIVDHQILQWGLRRLLQSHAPEIELVGIASGVTDAISVLSNASPHVILLDLDREPELIPQLVAATEARVLVFTRNSDQARQDKAILDGARGVLENDAPAEMFVEAIVKVHEGQLWLDRAATGRIFVELSRRESAKADVKEKSWADALTEREKKILSCMLENTGAPAKTLADILHISESTLRNHLTSIYGKLGIANRFELISFAYKNSHALTL